METSVIFLVFLSMVLCFCLWAIFNKPISGPGPIEFDIDELGELLKTGLSVDEIVELQCKKRLTFDEIIELQNNKRN